VHKGIDIFASAGAPVHAATDGMILYAGDLARGGHIVLLLGPKLQHGANRIRIHSERLEDCLQIGLHDNGAGISRENRNKIFIPFFTTRRSAGGTGLGLEIAASLLKTYGAEISLGECTQGALFWVRLPVE
jgi:nitrogen-specific signal transduction histidine kinase